MSKYSWLTDNEYINVECPEFEKYLYDKIVNHEGIIEIDGTQYECSLSEAQKHWTIAVIYINGYVCSITKRFYSYKPKIWIKEVEVENLEELHRLLFSPVVKSAAKC